MSERLQISCEKQGRDDSSSWSTRILTIDNATCTLTISRHHHPNNVFYHSVHVKEVQQWPHFTEEAIDGNLESLHSKRTLVILGIEVPVPNFTLDFLDAQNPHAQPTPHPADATSDTSSLSSAQYSFMAGDAHKKSRPVVSGGYDTWVLRFTTQEAYDVAVAAMKEMKNVHFNPKHSVNEGVHTGVLGAPLIVAPIGPL